MRSPRESSRTLTLSFSRTLSNSLISATVCSKRSGGNAVDFRVQFKRFPRRQIPPKLVLLAQHERELAAVAVLPLPGRVPQHPGRAAGGIKQTGEHLERRGLARAVRAQKAHQLARLDFEADIVYGERLLVLPVEQAP